MILRNKNILIISPNYWGKMYISKHHYAVELAKLQNTVFFLNPANLSSPYYRLEKVFENLFVIHYKPIHRGEKFLPKFAYRFLIWLQVKYILFKIKIPIDIVWSFSTGIFNNLNLFRAKFKIYHPVDQILSIEEKVTAKTADVIFTTMSFILNNFIEYKKPMYFINHGLSETYATIAEQYKANISKIYKSNHPVKIGFIGNLLKKFIDRKIFKTIVSQNHLCEFHLYGAYEFEDSNLGGYKNSEVYEFIDFLKNQKNVILHGVFLPKDLAVEIQNMDAFLLCIDIEKDDNHGSSAHKVIEYLSTGKILISNYLETFNSYKSLIQMVNEFNNQKLPELFQYTIHNLDFFNSTELQLKRIELALDNTYKKQIERIETIIQKLS